MNGESGVRFEHDLEVIRFAYRLVAEYDEHNRKQNKKFYRWLSTTSTTESRIRNFTMTSTLNSRYSSLAQFLKTNGGT
jgi:hypothetical protein